MAHLDPTNDYAFHKLFGTEKHKEIMIGFLNDILEGHRNHKTILDVEYLNPSHNPAFEISKASCVDVLCIDITGNRYIVEMQVAKQHGFDKRCQYYLAKTYSEQTLKGQDYTHLKPTILIAISEFNIIPEEEYFFSRHLFLDDRTFKQKLKDMSVVFIELPKFNKKEEELSGYIDYWCYFLKNAKETSIFDIEKITHYHKSLCYAHKALNEIALDENERLKYNAAEKARLDLLSTENTAREEGREEGIEIGIEKGREEGMKEERKKMIQSLMESHFDKETILKIMKISEDEYKTLM